MRYRVQCGSRERGFTLLELLIVLAIVGVMALLITPWMLGTIHRTRLVSAAKELASILQVARLEAIKEGREAIVEYDPARNAFQAYIDRNENQVFDGPQIDRLFVRDHRLPRMVELRGPTDGTPEGANAIAGWSDNTACPPGRLGPAFRSDGSVNCAGAFRFADSRGNFLETRIELPATSRIVIQKWFGGGNPNDNWFENGELGNAWSWH